MPMPLAGTLLRYWPNSLAMRAAAQAEAEAAAAAAAAQAEADAWQRHKLMPKRQRAAPAVHKLTPDAAVRHRTLHIWHPL